MANQSIVFELIEEGYRQMPPSQEAADIDGTICAESDCPKCRHHGMNYSPFTTERSYRAFAVCPRCGHREEF